MYCYSSMRLILIYHPREGGRLIAVVFSEKTQTFCGAGLILGSLAVKCATTRLLRPERDENADIAVTAPLSLQHTNVHGIGPPRFLSKKRDRVVKKLKTCLFLLFMYILILILYVFIAVSYL